VDSSHFLQASYLHHHHSDSRSKRGRWVYTSYMHSLATPRPHPTLRGRFPGSVLKTRLSSPKTVFRHQRRSFVTKDVFAPLRAAAAPAAISTAPPHPRTCLHALYCPLASCIALRGVRQNVRRVLAENAHRPSLTLHVHAPALLLALFAPSSLPTLLSNPSTLLLSLRRAQPSYSIRIQRHNKFSITSMYPE
jgi:hypothetical protein